jgi:hypothetical protein
MESNSSVLNVVSKINAATMTYAPGVLGSVLAVEGAVHQSIPGTAKKQLVIDAISAGAKAAQNVPIPEVQWIATLVDLFVSILNATGLFKHGQSKAAASE